MCNLYRMTKATAEVARLFGVQNAMTGANLGEEVYRLILHVERRDAKSQSEGLAAALRSAGAAATVQQFAGRGLRGHAEINSRMGDPAYPATAVVDDWLKRVFAR